MTAAGGTENVRVVGRYALYGAIAAGGMATVHLGRLLGPVGFSRTVAIKRLHAQFASDPEFVSMFLDEARLAARIRHPNVVPTLDVVATGGELFLVMDYVPGESVARLARALRERQQSIPLRILSHTMAGVLHGLHAAHEAKDERGHPLGIVHRDVSPQNVLVGTDGVPRVLDFGVAKAAGRMQTTKEGQIKGKLSYMPPEQLRGVAVSRQTDIYAVGVMLWELVTGQRLFSGDNEGAIVAKVLEGRIERPSQVFVRSRRVTLTDSVMRQLEALDETILRALSMQPEARFETARAMALELERKAPPATASEVGDWVENIARDVLSSRAAMVAEIESSASMIVEGGRESHVQSVLNAKSTLGPGARLSQLADQALSSSPPSGAHSQRAISAPPSSRHPHSSTSPMPTATSAKVPSYPAPLPPVTQPSSISVSTGNLARQAGLEGSGGKRTAIAVLIGVMLAASVLATVLVYQQHAATKPPADGIVANPPSAAFTDSVPTPLPTPPPPPLPSAAIATEESAADAGTVALQQPASPSPPHKASPTRPQPGPKPTPVKPTTATATPASTNDDCSTPYWYDQGGVKHYKPHCLNK